MEFASDRHRSAYERVLEITSKYSDFGTIAEAPGFVLGTGMARVFVLVLPWTDDHTVLQVRGYLDRDIESGPELAEHLLALNSVVVLGAWGWESGRLFYQHSILADEIEEPTFHATMNAVVGTVESQGAEIVERWGSADASGANASASADAGHPGGNGETPQEV